jgi:hypothetical protein
MTFCSKLESLLAQVALEFACFETFPAGPAGICGLLIIPIERGRLFSAILTEVINGNAAR